MGYSILVSPSLRGTRLGTRLLGHTRSEAAHSADRRVRSSARLEREPTSTWTSSMRAWLSTTWAGIVQTQTRLTTVLTLLTRGSTIRRSLSCFIQTSRQAWRVEDIVPGSRVSSGPQTFTILNRSAQAPNFYHYGERLAHVRSGCTIVFQ